MIHIATILKHNVIGKLLNHLVVFFINVLIVRLLGASISGSYFNELYVLNFIVFIFSAGLDYAAIAVLSRYPEMLQAVNRLLIGMVAVFAACLLLVYLLSQNLWDTYFNQSFIAIMLFSTGNLLLIFFQGVLSALKKFNLQNIILCACNLVFLAYLLFFFTEGEQGNLEKITLAYAVLFLAEGLLMYMFSISGTPAGGSKINLDVFFRSGVYIMLSSLVYFAFLRADNFFVERYDSGDMLGNYVQCGKIGQYFLYFSSVISSTLLPFISTETVGASYDEWKKMMKPYILLICLAALFIAATGHYLFPAIFGEDFGDMYPLMLILLPGFVSLGILTLLNAVYIGKGNIRMIFAGDMMGLVLVVLFDFLFVPKHGAMAAAIISSAAYCIVFLFLLNSFKKQFSLPTKGSPVIQL